MLKCESYESRKNRLDDIWLNPKYLISRQSAAKPQTEEGSTTIPVWEYSLYKRGKSHHPMWMKI